MASLYYLPWPYYTRRMEQGEQGAQGAQGAHGELGEEAHTHAHKARLHERHLSAALVHAGRARPHFSHDEITRHRRLASAVESDWRNRMVRCLLVANTPSLAVESEPLDTTYPILPQPQPQPEPQPQPSPQPQPQL